MLPDSIYLKNSPLKVEMELRKPGKAYFELSDLSGKIIRSFSYSEKTGGQKSFVLQPGHVPAGTYLLTFWLDGELIGTQQLIIL